MRSAGFAKIRMNDAWYGRGRPVDNAITALPEKRISVRACKYFGFTRDGGLAEYVTTPTSSLVPIPSTLPDKVACLAEPLACAINALEQARVERSDDVLVLGGGPVGLLTALGAKALGAGFLVIETDNRRLDQSREFRKALDIDAAQESPTRKFDVAVNACSATEAFVAAISHVETAGRISFFSGLTGNDPVPVSYLNEIHYRQLMVCGAYGCTKSQFSRAVDLLDRFRNEAALLIDKELPLEETESALERILTGKGMKVVVNLGGKENNHLSPE